MPLVGHLPKAPTRSSEGGGAPLRTRRGIRTGRGGLGWLAALPLVLFVLGPMSAGAQPAVAGDAPASDPVTLNFQDADLDFVLDAIARAIGFNYVLAPEVRRKVTVQGRIARRDLFDVLLAILEVHGLAAVRSGEVYKIIRIANAQSQGLPVVVGVEPDPARRPEELVTHVVHLSYGSAVEIARVLSAMISREGTVAVHRETNVLVLTDSVDKLRRHLRIIQSLDVPTAQEQFQVFPLRFADATALAGLLGQLFASPPTAALRAPVASARTGEPAEPGGTAPPPGPVTAGDAGPSRPTILADPRTNTLLATGPPAVLERVQALVTRLDTETPPARGVFLYRVEHLRAKELAATLSSLFRRRGAASADGVGPRPGSPPPGPGLPGPAPGPPEPAAPGDGERDDLATGDIRVIADEPTNTLLITATPPMWAALQPILTRLDRMPRRVLIEILVAEITLDDSTSLGIEWALRSERGIRVGGERLSLSTGFDVGVPGIQAVPPGLFFILQNADIVTLLQAFSKVNRVNVLSSPHILTSENKKAQIHVGRSVPILTTQQQPTTGIAAQAQATAVITTTVDYRDTGIILTVMPRISDNRFVALDVRQEVSDAIPNLVGGTESPVITKRVAETSVVVAENETLILGGLIEERKVRDREGIPFLSRIPILGYLFGATTDSVRKTELLILVTPRVVLDPGEARSVYEEFKRRAPELKREIERAPPAAPPAPERPSGVPQGFLQDDPARASTR